MVTVVCILVGGLVSAHLKKYAVSQIGSSLSGFRGENSKTCLKAPPGHSLLGGSSQVYKLWKGHLEGEHCPS